MNSSTKEYRPTLSSTLKGIEASQDEQIPPGAEYTSPTSPQRLRPIIRREKQQSEGGYITFLFHDMYYVLICVINKSFNKFENPFSSKRSNVLSSQLVQQTTSDFISVEGYLYHLPYSQSHMSSDLATQKTFQIPWKCVRDLKPFHCRLGRQS